MKIRDCPGKIEASGHLNLGPTMKSGIMKGESALKTTEKNSLSVHTGFLKFSVFWNSVILYASVTWYNTFCLKHLSKWQHKYLFTVDGAYEI